MKRNVLFLFALCLFLSSNLFAQAPANDDCANAIAIGDTTGYEFDTRMATTDGPFHPTANCRVAANEVDSIYLDIWFAYTPTFTGQALWDMCQSAGFDTKIAVYEPTASCPVTDNDLLDCNEDGPNCANFASQLIFDVMAGQTYLLRLGGYGDTTGTGISSGEGTFSIGEFMPAVANDFCADASVLTEGTDIPVNNVMATTDGPEHPGASCVGFGDNSIQSDVWYTFTATRDGAVKWSTCDMINFDSRLGVYNPGTACPPMDSDLLACNDDGAVCPAYSSELVFNVVGGETYLLRLGGFGGDQGTGTMSLEYTTPPMPPANDLCANAQELEDIVTVYDADNFYGVTEGTTFDATFDNNTFIFPSCLGNTNGGEFGEVFFTFNNSGITELEIRFGVSTVDAAFFVDIWEGCNGPVDPANVANSCFYFDGTTGSFFTDTIGTLAATPTDYTMRVTTRETSDLSGDFFIQLVSDEISTSNKNVSPTKSLSIFPNPTAGNLAIDMDLISAGNTEYQIINTLGQVVQFVDAGYLNAGYNQLQVNAQDLSKGIYFLRLSSEGKSTTARFIKQ